MVTVTIETEVLITILFAHPDSHKNYHALARAE